jgi:acyl-coenzyme A synthetase/AMP-(fatty) acid ligase
MLKAGGIWVSPTEVEGALMEHEAVLECAVVGAEDAEGLVKPKAYVVLNEGHVPGPETAEALQAFVKQRLAVYKYPRWVEFLPELPKTATGKIQRYKLRG